MHHLLPLRFAGLLCIFLLLSGCDQPPTKVAQHQQGTAATATATIPPQPTPRPATPTLRPATATAVLPTIVPPTVEPTPEPLLPTPTVQPPPDIPTGWIYHDVSQLAGLGFALPPSWHVVRLDQDGIDALAEAAPELPHGKQSPEELAASGMKLIACECHIPTNKPGVPTLFIMTDNLVSPMPLHEVVTNLVRGIEQSPVVVGPVKRAPIPHPTGPAEAIQYRMRSGDTVLTFTHYVMVQERHFVFVGILASVARAEQDTPTYYRIIQTMRFTTALRPM